MEVSRAQLSLEELGTAVRANGILKAIVPNWKGNVTEPKGAE